MAGEVDIIKEKIDIVDFLRSYIDLHPAGKNFKAICPFHSEKTASFVVSPERRMWHCFGSCGEGGDIFKFLMKHENLEFYEALKVLAERAGVPLRALDPQKQKEFGVLYDMHETAKDFYRKQLSSQTEALSYLRGRGLTDETMEEFGLGFSPGGEALTLFLLQSGYDMSNIVRGGLAQKNAQGLHRDKFYRRIMFPIYNSMGKVVAFTGRILPENGSPSTSSGDIPKYLNSPETPIFNKSHILYGFHVSKNHIAKSRTAFLVEGQMDVLMSWQSGIQNVVAVSGTGLTTHHLERLRRLADTLVLSFDNDTAGLKAMERSLDLFADFDFYARVASLGEHKDPADAAKADKGFLERAVLEARPAFSILFESYFKGISFSDVALKKRLVRRSLEKIRALKSSTERDIWTKELSGVSGISESGLLAEFASMSLPASPVSHAPDSVFTPTLLSRPRRIELIAKRLVSLALLRAPFFERLMEHREWLPKEYCSILEEPQGVPATELSMLGSYEFGGAKEEELLKEFDDLLSYIQLEFLKQRRNELRLKIRECERKGTNEESQTFLAEFHSLSREMDKLKR
ncbi:DNA primase [Candidatus Jorgensenbacteria bacterium RIFCSPLOWO2_01_FULL_45_25b]|uniref:DNA primase n=1 Tax=Candidatus Jorgensenbacteria bacterium RIFCSPLOWO2_01_FULL_45_25b TaxID=1798471 RepID=A0A1F6BRZ6_9BACT|nr:MAG: DNA primase [Candidatus Jorgensenbacteria bacterium RIFCSPLOWO2_01_FULL_45_25b]